MLLETIHRLTPEHHKDAQDIPKVIDKITQLLVQLNKKVGLSDNAFHLEQISDRILTPKAHVMYSFQEYKVLSAFTKKTNFY